MSGFPEIPRATAARQVLDRLDTAAWVHVHGAAGLGKDETVAALLVLLDGKRAVARVTAAPDAGVSESDYARNILRSVAVQLEINHIPAVEPDGLNGDIGKPLFDALSTTVSRLAAPSRPLIVIDRADWFVFCDTMGPGFLGMLAASDPPFRLVTVATFPVALLRPELTVSADFALRSFPVPGLDRLGLPLAPAQETDSEGAPSRDELAAWFDDRRAAADKDSQLADLTDAEFGTLIDRYVGLHRGQPRLVMVCLSAVLEAMSQARKGTSPVTLEVEKQIESTWQAEAETFRAGVFPEICVPEHLPGPLAEFVADRISKYRELGEESGARVHTRDDENNDWYRALGLLTDVPAEGGTTRPMPAFPGLLNRLDDDAQKRAIADLRHHAERWREMRLARTAEEDGLISAIHARVRQAFCDTPTGLARGYQLSEYETEALEPPVHYRVTLTREVMRQSEPGKKGDRRRRPRRSARVTETLHVFTNLTPHGERLWLRTAALLRRLSAVRTTALVTLHRGGILAADPDEQGELGDLSYVLVSERGQPLTEDLDKFRRSLCEPRRFAGQEAPPYLAEEIAQLALALRSLHAESIAHRRIEPANIRASIDQQTGAARLLLTGFEFAVYIKEAVAARHRAVGLNPNADPLTPDDIPFRTAEQLNLAAMEHDDAAANLTGWAGADINALGALIAHLAVGPVPADVLQSAHRELKAIPREGQNRLAECHRILGTVRDEILSEKRWDEAARAWAGTAQSPATGGPEGTATLGAEAKREYLRTVRELVELMTRGHGRPPEGVTADFVYRRLKYAAARLRKQLASVHDDRFAVIFDAVHMGPKLSALGLIKFDTGTPDGAEELREQLRDWLRSAEGIHYSEEGFIGAVREADETRQRAAKYVIVCDEVVFFGAFFTFHGSGEDERLLRLAFTMRREHVRLPFIDEEPPVPFPDKFELLSSNEIGRKRLDGLTAWTPRMAVARAHAVETDRQVAAASLDFHSRIELAKEQLKVFPVKVTKDRDGVVFKLDVERYRKATKPVQAFERRLVLNGRDPVTFFVDAIEDWRQDVDAGTAKLQFRPAGLSAGRPFDVNLRSVDAAECHAENDDRYTQAGELVFSDLRGAAVASERQQGAIRRLMDNSSVIDHLQNPRSDAPIKLPLSLACGPDLGDKTRQTLRNMKSGVPLSALQGPPGTGKTTVIANLVAELLREDETTRILVASQSHAATDTTMNRVVSVCSEQFGAEEAPDAIRLVSTAGLDRVSASIRASHTVEALVESRRSRAQNICAERLAAARDENLKAAYKALDRALRRATFDLWTRIERTAPLVFGTTAAASQAGRLPGLGASHDASGRFDVVVIDEAAKAYGIDLVQPLSLAARAIMVGDAAQLPPFDMQGTLELYDRARTIYLDTRDEKDLPPDVALICDSDNYEEAKSWLTPFARVFDKCPPVDGAEAERDGQVPLTQRLRTQYRSLEPIGRLVSETFYDGKIKTAPHLCRRDGAGYVDDVLFAPLVDGVRVAPVVTWLDTSGLDPQVFDTRAARQGKLWNEGECRLGEWVVAQSVHALGTAGTLTERLKVMSPYATQVAALKRRLRASGTLGAEAQASLDEIVQTVDSAQGAEADLVVVSMVRSGEISAGGGEDRDRLRRNLFRNYGFLASSERLNVTFSRARKNLVIIGDFAFFDQFEGLLQEWIEAEPVPDDKHAIRRRHGFWKKLLGQFSEPGVTSDIMRIPVAQLEEFRP